MDDFEQALGKRYCICFLRLTIHDVDPATDVAHQNVHVYPTPVAVIIKYIREQIRQSQYLTVIKNI